ncbi:MAG TPA: ATP-dependent Clp protease adaptor ClpS [Pirellulales bacterium]|nr:ATP-dependent Clp protease adaptor ClpS [Pirellulales bacterium]
MPESVVAEPGEVEVAPKKKQQPRSKPKRQPRYNVVLWDDDKHTYAYVIIMLQELFGHPIEKGYELAKEVDTRGRACVLTTTKEHAELKRDQIHAYGKDDLIDGCQGSMWATIEPIES